MSSAANCDDGASIHCRHRHKTAFPNIQRNLSSNFHFNSSLGALLLAAHAPPATTPTTTKTMHQPASHLSRPPPLTNLQRSKGTFLLSWLGLNYNQRLSFSTFHCIYYFLRIVSVTFLRCINRRVCGCN